MFGINLKFTSLALLLFLIFLKSQAQDKGWTFEDCINQALTNNIDVKQAALRVEQDNIEYNQSRSNRLPSITASANYNLVWTKTYNSEMQEYSSLHNTSNTSYGINSSVSLFNGFKMKNEIEQSELLSQGSKYYSERIKESIEINILNAYLSILYTMEEVNNAFKQLEATKEQLMLAEERMKLGIISKSDYLQIKSALATEKLTLANANSVLTMEKVSLMQLMEVPVTKDFNITTPDITEILSQESDLNTLTIYKEALLNKPQIKEAELNVKSVMLDKKIAKASYYPVLSFSAGVSTVWWESTTAYNYTSQLNNLIAPTLGLNLSIPVFQKNQIQTNIKTAQIAINSAKLDEINIKNNLRKEIEQAVIDIYTTKTQYQANIEQYEATKELYIVAAEKFELEIINSVDFMIIKNDMIISESNLLQTKYKLIFSHKILDFYRGIPVSLTN